MNIETNIHILDCTKIAVHYENENYEGSSIAIDRKGDRMRGYKLSTLRGLYGDTGIIEEVKLGTASTHDLMLSKDMLINSPCLHDNDIVIMDRGFLSRELINTLKNERNVDVYIPVRSNMDICHVAIAMANEIDDWKPHPTREKQMICKVSNIGEFWTETDSTNNVDLNACVVWFADTQSYAVFVTTDLSKSAKDIIKTYELRTEIEEDFRQMKEFWKLEDFKSTKLNVIAFHLVCVLYGYLFYQLYLSTEDGQCYIGKSLPVILKNQKQQFLGYLVLFSGQYFCTMGMREFMEFRDSCSEAIKEFILGFLN